MNYGPESKIGGISPSGEFLLTGAFFIGNSKQPFRSKGNYSSRGFPRARILCHYGMRVGGPGAVTSEPNS
jgi:hypothetical protein